MQLVLTDSMPPNDAIACGLRILFQTNAWAERKVPDIEMYVAAPFAMGQAVIALTDDGFPVGFMTWANIPTSSFERAITGKGWSVEDWNSGGVVWVMDMVAVRGYGKEFAEELKARAAKEGISPVWWRGKHERMGSYNPAGVNHG